MKLKLYEPDGSELTRFDPQSTVPHYVWKKRGDFCTQRSGWDPRYGRITDLDTGADLLVRHSYVRSGYMAIQLKPVRSNKVLLTLARYDRRSNNQFYSACAEADRTLARLAGLVSKVSA